MRSGDELMRIAIISPVNGYRACDDEFRVNVDLDTTGVATAPVDKRLQCSIRFRIVSCTDRLSPADGSTGIGRADRRHNQATDRFATTGSSR